MTRYTVPMGWGEGGGRQRINFVTDLINVGSFLVKQNDKIAKRVYHQIDEGVICF